MGCRRVLTGDAADQPGRLGGELSAAGAQRAAPGQREPGREGDPQLRAGGPGRPGRAGPVGVVDLAVPDPGAGRGRDGRARGGEVEVLDSRRLGAAWTLDRIWERLGIGAAIRRVAAGRRLDGDAVERVVFALVAQRACEPGSKLAATGWVAERVAIEGCAGFTDDAAYAGDGLPARRPGRDRRRDLLLGRAPAQPRSGHRVRRHDLHLLGDRDRRRARRAGRGPGDDDEVTQPDRGRGAGVRALQGPPRRSAAGGDRDGGHPRRGPGAVLDLPRRHRRHRDHPHRSRTTWAGGGCAGWCGWPTAGSPPPPTGPT